MKTPKILGMVLVFILATTCVWARSNVLITEVMYNPIGTENGLEYVELFNQNDVPVNIGGWIISSSSYDTDATIPNGTVIPAKSHFLIADEGFALSKPASWPLADHEEALTLSNTAGGVALVGSTVVEDSVGWGPVSNPKLFEGSPAALGDEGLSLTREKSGDAYIDTGNNSKDFTYQQPSPSNSIGQLGPNKDLAIELTIEDSAPDILYVNVTDEAPEKSGIQVFPAPGQTKNLEVAVGVRDLSGDIKGVGLGFDNISLNLTDVVNETQPTRVYSGKIPINYHITPGLHYITVTACDSGDCATSTIGIDIGEVLAFNVDTTKISIDTNLGGSYQLIGDLDPSTPAKPTLQNTGNSPLNLMVSTNGLQLNQSQIPPSAISVQISRAEPVEFFELSSNYLTTESLAVKGILRLSLRFDLPRTLVPGVYNGHITLTAVK